MTKSFWVSALLCANLILLTGIALFVGTPQTAVAQPTGLAGNYLTVAGEIQSKHDALYIVDLRSRLLHAFYVDRTNLRFVYADTRDLERDFRNNRD
ncbi:MAG: hypothetical protein IPM64_12055 [Phycisphaerales bacterium]|nr:hypothetical protein [Phycisphaerales bacterium]